MASDDATLFRFPEPALSLFVNPLRLFHLKIQFLYSDEWNHLYGW